MTGADYGIQKVLRDYRLTLPKEFREVTGVQPGDNIAVNVTDDGALEVRAIEDVIVVGEREGDHDG